MNVAEITQVFVDLDVGLERFVVHWAAIAHERIVYRTPIDKGDLKRSWKTEHFPMKWTESNTRTYAAYIENGTPKIRPFKMIGTTVLEAAQISQLAKQRANLK